MQLLPVGRIAAQRIVAFGQARPQVEVAALSVFDRIAVDPNVFVGVRDPGFIVGVEQCAGAGDVVNPRRFDVDVDVFVEVRRVERYGDFRCEAANPRMERRFGRVDRNDRGFAADCAGRRLALREIARHLVVVLRVGVPGQRDLPEIGFPGDLRGIAGVGREIARIDRGINPVAAVGDTAFEVGALRGLFGRALFARDVGDFQLFAGVIAASGERAVLAVPGDEHIGDFGDRVAFEAAGLSERDVRQRMEGHGERRKAFAVAERTLVRICVIARTGNGAEQYAAQQHAEYHLAFHLILTSVLGNIPNPGSSSICS